MRIVQVISDYIRRSILTTQGDLVVRGAAVPERLAAGAAGTLLTGQGAGAIPSYVAPTVYPGVFAYRTTDVSIPTATHRKIPFNRVDYDTESDFDLTTGKWFPSVTGLYLFTFKGKLMSCNDQDNFTLGIRKEGLYTSIRAGLRTGDAGNITVMGAGTYVCTAGEWYELVAYHNSGVNRVIKGGLFDGAYWSMNRIPIGG